MNIQTATQRFRTACWMNLGCVQCTEAAFAVITGLPSLFFMESLMISIWIRFGRDLFCGSSGRPRGNRVTPSAVVLDYMKNKNQPA